MDFDHFVVMCPHNPRWVPHLHLGLKLIEMICSQAFSKDICCLCHRRNILEANFVDKDPFVDIIVINFHMLYAGIKNQIEYK